MSVNFVETSSAFRTLAEAKEWIETRGVQETAHVPFLLMAHEESAPGIAKSWRSYGAVEVRTFLDEMQRNQAALAAQEEAGVGGSAVPPSVHELVPAGAPCKTYAEFDFKKFDELEKFGAHDRDEMVVMLESMLERFLEFLLARLNTLIKEHDPEADELTRADDVVLLTAHKASKWSVHVIIDRSLEHESVAWASTVDCGNFILDALVEFNEPLANEALDQHVYSDNHTLRIYRAAKHEEPERILRDAAGPYDAPYNEATMLRSLVSLLRIDRDRLGDELAEAIHNQGEGVGEYGLPEGADARLVLLTSAYIVTRKPFADDEECWRPLTFNGVSRTARLSSLGVSRGGGRANSSSELVKAICAAAQLESYKPRRTFTVVNSSFATLSCDSKYCELRGGEHGLSASAEERKLRGSSPVYLVLDFVNRMWRQRCWSSKCDNSLAVWRPMDAQLSDLCGQYVRNESMPNRRARGAARVLFGTGVPGVPPALVDAIGIERVQSPQ